MRMFHLQQLARRWQQRHAAGFVALAVALLALAGCSVPSVANPAPLGVDAYRQAFDASVEVLRERGFVVDRQDYRFGKITSQPRFAPSAGELWHRDNSTFDQTLSSSLNDQRRVVTITIEPAKPADAAAPVPAENAAAGDYSLAVRVDIERLSDTTRRLTGATDGYAIVQHLSDRPDELRQARIPARAYYVLERDPQMEARIMSDILGRLGPQ